MTDTEQHLRYERFRYGINRFGATESTTLMPAPTLGGQKYPRYPIGVEAIDRENASSGGSGHGLTLFVGGSGIGKSYAGMGAALENAYGGRAVIHIDAEMDQGLLQSRIWAWHKSSKERTLEDYGALEGDSYFWIPAPSMFPFDEIAASMVRCVRPNHEGVIVVVDSLNSVCDRLKPAFRGENEFEKLYRFLNQAGKLTRDTQGHVGWILISEINKEGKVYGGERMKHRCNQVFDFTFDEDTGCTRIDCTRNRDGEMKDYGRFIIDYKNARMKKHMADMTPEEEEEAF